jgi:hypothetical protein
MNARLTKTEKVLAFFTLDDDGTALYEEREPVLDDGTLWPLSKADYEDMGSPALITVTILPGDFLNCSHPQGQSGLSCSVCGPLDGAAVAQ